MSTYVLVHGSWHGAWCWYRIIPRLRAAGHTVIAPDLAGLGSDKTPLVDITLDRWRDDVVRAIDAAAEPVILVGHSRGGLLISAAAEVRPDRVRLLVYLTAFLLRDGEALFNVSMLDEESALLGQLQVAADGVSATVKDDVIVEAFYGGCSPDDIALAQTLLQPEPLKPLGTPLHVTEARFGRVPRVYIECLEDRAITPAAQRRFHTQSACRSVISMRTDHSPFFSAPDELARHLIDLAD